MEKPSLDGLDQTGIIERHRFETSQLLGNEEKPQDANLGNKGGSPLVSSDAEAGELSNYFYTCALPKQFAKYSVRRHTSSEEVKQHLTAEGWKGPLPDPRKEAG